MVLVGIDIGGTFTDLVCAGNGETRTVKVNSTPADFSEGFCEAVLACGISPERIDAIFHGTTVATNALIERKGARCGLITTDGFRDLLEMRRGNRRKPYGIEKAFVPLVPRDMRAEVEERSGPDGVVVPVDLDAVLTEAEKLWSAGAEVIVVSFLHATVSPENELSAVSEIRSRWPDRHVFSAREICDEPLVFERTATAVASAYVTPLMKRYLDKLVSSLKTESCAAPLRIVTSDGGLVNADDAGTAAIRTALSGPAAGVWGAQRLCAELGYDAFIACDMGGTSFDACLVSGGIPALTRKRELDFGLPIAIPAIDIATLGAGGGSIARLDGGGRLEVGPDGVGASPGPACYGNQRLYASVLDADLVLGRVGCELRLADRERALDEKAARQTIAERIGRGLGVDTEIAAAAILDTVEENMAECIRLLALEKRLPLDDLVLVTYGGAGPLHAAAIAGDLGISELLVPYRAGVFSAWGGLMMDRREVLTKRLDCLLDEDGVEKLRDLALQNEFGTPAAVSDQNTRVVHEIEVCYRGQSSGIVVTCDLSELCVSGLRNNFENRYQSSGTLIPGHPLVIRSLQSTLISKPDHLVDGLLPRDWKGGNGEAMGTREVWFEGSFHCTKVFDRDVLVIEAILPGPVIIEEPGSTTVVPPGFDARIDPSGTLHISNVRAARGEQG
jgi:N-methylhydantoinase A